MFTKKDLFFSVFTGFYTGFITWRIFEYLNIPEIGSRCIISLTGFVCVEGVSWFWLVAAVPIFWILGVNLGYFLGKWFEFFNQFGKFSAIGFTNAAVDFGVLNILIAWSGVASGILYAVFKTISFIISVTHSFFWNRHWVFKSQSEDKSREFFKFISVYIIASAVNVGTASGIVSFIDPMFGVNQTVWANLGAIAGSALALAFSFVGVRSIVFKKNDSI